MTEKHHDEECDQAGIRRLGIGINVVAIYQIFAMPLVPLEEYKNMGSGE